MKVSIIGSGTMGSGIAQIAAMNNCNVNLYDVCNESLENAKNKETVLISYGDPYIATTHLELKTRAMRENIKTKTIHSSSIVSSLIGEVGLHYYKVGKVLTIMNDPKSMITPYNIIFDNLLTSK